MDEQREEKPNAVPIFDKAAMLERMMGDEDLARTVAAGFLEDIPTQIEVLEGYVNAADAASSERQAHSIKGAAAAVGGESLREVAFKAELAAKADDLETVKKALPEITARFGRLKEAMETELFA